MSKACAKIKTAGAQRKTGRDKREEKKVMGKGMIKGLSHSEKPPLPLPLTYDAGKPDVSDGGLFYVRILHFAVSSGNGLSKTQASRPSTEVRR